MGIYIVKIWGNFITWYACLLAPLILCTCELVCVTLWCWIQKHSMLRRECHGSLVCEQLGKNRFSYLKSSVQVGIWKVNKNQQLESEAIFDWSFKLYSGNSEAVKWFVINGVYRFISTLFRNKLRPESRWMGWDVWEQTFTHYLWPGCKKALLTISWAI